jgi:hypothetical protein
MPFWRFWHRSVGVLVVGCAMIVALVAVSSGQEGGTHCYMPPPDESLGSCSKLNDYTCRRQDGSGSCSYCDGTATLPSSHCATGTANWHCEPTDDGGVDCGTQFIGTCASGSSPDSFVCQKTDVLGESDGCSYTSGPCR